MNAGELIDELGGNAVVAQMAGVLPTAVCNWRRHGCFPPRLSIRLRAAARAYGVAIPDELFREMKGPGIRRRGQ